MVSAGGSRPCCGAAITGFNTVCPVVLVTDAITANVALSVNKTEEKCVPTKRQMCLTAETFSAHFFLFFEREIKYIKFIFSKLNCNFVNVNPYI